MFCGCAKLESIAIPKSVTVINASAFYDCKLLKSVTIPSNVTSIKSNAFDVCSALETVNIENDTSPVNLTYGAFNNSPIQSGSGKINVPCNLVETYKTANNWKYYAAQIQTRHPNTVIKNAKDATCIAKGYMGDTHCKVCDIRLKTGTEIAMTAHNTSGNVTHKDVTCTAEGVVGGTYCTVCNNGKTAAEQTIAKLEHSYGSAWKNNSTQHWHKCDNCTATDTKVNHTFVQKKGRHKPLAGVLRLRL